MAQTPHNAQPKSIITAIIYAAPIIAGGMLAIGAIAQQHWIAAIAALALAGIAVLAELTHRAAPLAGVAFVGFMLLAVLNLLDPVHPLWSFLGIAAALVGWDMHYFRQRLHAVSNIDAAPHLLRAHLQRLLIAIGTGVALSIATLWIHISYGVGVALLLSLLAVIGLSQVVGFLRRLSD